MFRGLAEAGSIAVNVKRTARKRWRFLCPRNSRMRTVGCDLLRVELHQAIQPFENQGHAAIFQNKSRNRIEKTRFAQKASCCFGEILANLAWRICDLFEYRASSIDHGDKVFQIVACLEIHLSTSAERFHLGTQKVGSCDHPDRLAARQYE
jgi:hypothetical protein